MHDQAYFRAFNLLYGRMHPGDPKNQGRCASSHEQLPDAVAYYQNRYPNEISASTGWVTVRCPFHNDKNPSLSINLDSGGFCCHACGERGSNVIEFHRKLKGISFTEAAKELGV